MRKSNIVIRHSMSTVAILTVLILWQIYALRVDNHYLMPYPYDVLKSLIELLTTWDTYLTIFQSLLRLLISLAISIVAGLGLGLISGVRYEVEALLKPIVVTLRTLPVITIIIVVLIMWGNVVSLYIISFLLLFPIIYQTELDGIKNIDRTLLEVLVLECNKCNLRTIKLVFLPLSMPFLRTGIIQSIGLGIKVLVVSEFIAQTKVSIGRELYYNRVNLDYSYVFAWTIILIGIVLLVEHIVERYLKTQADS